MNCDYVGILASHDNVLTYILCSSLFTLCTLTWLFLLTFSKALTHLCAVTLYHYWNPLLLLYFRAGNKKRVSLKDECLILERDFWWIPRSLSVILTSLKNHQTLQLNLPHPILKGCLHTLKRISSVK